MMPSHPPERDHWASVVRGAERGGRVANRRDWRVVLWVYIADAEARKRALNGMILETAVDR